MLIHVVQQGETIHSIAVSYRTSEIKLIRDNGLEESKALVAGETLVITYPELTYTVKEGDTLKGIANAYNISIIQLLRNNPYLSETYFLSPGDTIVIKYNTKGTISVHGNALPFISKEALRKTLPYLTYLSIFNYSVTKEGELITYYDDTEVINMTKEYGVMPLMLLTTLTIRGEPNIELAYEILLNQEFQNTHIENVLYILRTKGYQGVNISFQYINVSNIHLYENLLSNIADRLNKEGYLVFVSINPNITTVNDQIIFEEVNYSVMDELTQNIIFLRYDWATKIIPPSPVSSLKNIDFFLNYVSQSIPMNNVIIGIPNIGYDWELPYIPGRSNVHSLTLERAIDLARNQGATIQFDTVSQTPFFEYVFSEDEMEIKHIVWFIDARSINSILDLVQKYHLHGIAIWNTTIYNAQLFTIINSQYEIEKVLDSTK